LEPLLSPLMLAIEMEGISGGDLIYTGAIGYSSTESTHPKRRVGEVARRPNIIRIIPQSIIYVSTANLVTFAAMSKAKMQVGKHAVE